MTRKSFSAMAMLFAGLAQLSTAQPAPVAARNLPTLNDQVEAAQRAMSAATITIKGKAFPRRLETPGAKTQAFCEPYDTRQQQKMAELLNELPKGAAKNHSEAFSATYSPTLPVWVISSYERIEANRIGPVSAAIDAVPGGFHMLSSSQFQSEYNSMKNYVLSLNIPDKIKADLSVKLEDQVKNYSSYSTAISSSHGMVMQKAVLSGAGKFNGRTAYHGWINTVEVCAPPEVTDLAALDQRLKGWVNSVVKNIPGPIRLNPSALTN